MKNRNRNVIFNKLSLSILAMMLFLLQFNISASHSGQSFDPKYQSTTTYEDEGGKYDIFHILSKVNVFSFGVASGSHIYGPAIVKDYGGKILFNNPDTIDNQFPLPEFTKIYSDNLVVGDLTLGQSSFVGGENKFSGFEGDGRSRFQDNVEADKNGLLYLGDSNIVMSKQEEVNGIASKVNIEVLGESNSIRVATDAWINNDYIDWVEAMEVLDIQSKSLVDKSSRTVNQREIREIDNTKYLLVNDGEIINVPEEIDFEYIGFVVDEESYKQKKFYNSKTTIINYLGEENQRLKDVVLVTKNIQDNPIHLNGHGGFHIPQFGGEKLNSSISTDLNAGINLIHNFPYANRLDFASKNDSFGHIVAINADTVKNGGNQNGTVIANSFLSEGTEFHFWPFNGNFDDSIPLVPIEKPSVPLVPIEKPSVPSIPLVPIEKPSIPLVPIEKPSVPLVPIEKPSIPLVPIEKPSIPLVPIEKPSVPLVPIEKPSVPLVPIEKPSVPLVPIEKPSVPLVPIEKPSVPLVPIEKPSVPLVPIEKPSVPLVPIEKPSVPLVPIEKPSVPLVPIEKPSIPLTPIEPPVSPIGDTEDIKPKEDVPNSKLPDSEDNTVSNDKEVLPATGIAPTFSLGLLFILSGFLLTIKKVKTNIN